jgi:hypothetical protein
MGFILFGMKINPTLLQDTIAFGENKAELANTLVDQGWQKEAADLVAEHP